MAAYPIAADAHNTQCVRCVWIASKKGGSAIAGPLCLYLLPHMRIFAQAAENVAVYPARGGLFLFYNLFKSKNCVILLLNAF